MASVIAITSGKGGVGKTNAATNLGLALAARNAKVCLFDADTGLANINILLGIQPQFTLEHLLAGEKKLDEIMLRLEGGLHIVPAASGVQRCTDLDAEKRQLLIRMLQRLEQRFDFILIDTAAGIDSGVLDFVASAQYRIVVITPEPTALTDAFALLKMLALRGGKRNLFALVNRVGDYKSSQKVFKRFQSAVAKYLKLDIRYLGYLADDPALPEAVAKQVPVVTGAPDSSVSCCFFALADIVKRQFLNEKNLPYFSHYWRKLAAAGQHPARQQELTVASALSAATKQKANGELRMADIFEWLQRRDYPEAEMKELVTTLESLYQKRHLKPVKSMDSVVAEWLAEASASEEHARRLYRALADGFQRRFQRRLDDPIGGLLQQLQDESYSREEFSALLRQFGEIYQNRFGVAYYGDGEQLLDKIARLLRGQ